MTQAKSASSIASFVMFAVATLLLLAGPAHAYDARIGWNPVSNASGYKVYVGTVGAAFSAPINVGNPKTESDGVVRVYVQDLPLGADIRFAVAAVDGSGGESPKSNEITITYAQVANVVDSDGDGLKDAVEDKNLNGQVDAGETDPKKADTDGDGLSDGDEVNKYGTDPLKADTDGDGLRDGDEVTKHKTDPKKADTDGDGLSDGDEVNKYGTDPLKADTDGDGVSDGDEVAAGSDPKNPGDSGASCGNGRVEPGEECDDGNSSNDDGCLTTCKRAECIPSQGGCSDNNPCTTDSCVQGRCVRTHNTNTCDDGIACTTNDRCSQGVCSGADSCETGSRCVVESGMCEAVAPLDGKWLPAATYPAAVFRGAMTVGLEYADGSDDDPSADALVPLLVFPDTTSSSFDAGSGDEIVYTINLPETGRWYLWGRMYYPGEGNAANSFFVRVNDGEALKFGNNREFFRQWHWDGDGNRETGQGQPLLLGDLTAGAHKLVVEKREAAGELSPRLDVLFVTQDPSVVPTDADAEVALEICPQGICLGDDGTDVCGDATNDGRVTVVDAWSILTASIGVAEACGLAVCDVDGNDAVNATDALVALRVSVGVDVDALSCKPALGFEVYGASKLTSVDFTVDYSGSNVSFATGSAPFVCTAALPRATSAVSVVNNAGAKKLRVGVDFREPLDGDLHVLECRFKSGGAYPIPATLAITLDGYTRVGGRNPSNVPTVTPTVRLP
jgi:cysteine-rich repeat protein